jgi:hypothetical protein
VEQHEEALKLPAPDGDLLQVLVSTAALAHQERVPTVPEPYASIGGWRN